MKTNFNYAKMRCKKLHWMTEITVWSWWMTFVDAHSQLQPKHNVATGDVYTLPWAVNFGFGLSIEPQGPPII